MSRTTLLLIVALTGFSACSKEQTIEPEQPPELKAAMNNLMPNGGGSGTTDWVGENIAVHWSEVTGDASILTGINWTGNYQRIERVTGQFVLQSPPTPDDNKQYHTVTFKYRSNTRIWVAMMYSGRCTYVMIKLEPTDKPQTVTVRAWSPRIYCIRWYNSPCYPGFLEIDEVNVY